MTERNMPVWLCQRTRFESVRMLPLSASEFAILKELIQRAPSGYCYPSVRTLANDIKTSERTVRRALMALEALGLIRRVQRRKTNGQNGGYHYFITMAGYLTSNADGHSDQAPADSVSGQNIKYKQLDSEELSALIQIERDVFDTLSDVLSLKQTPNLISGELLTHWLHDRWNRNPAHLIDFVETSAKAFKESLQLGKARLQDWQHFIDYLNQRAKEGLSTSSTGEPPAAFRLRKYLAACFKKQRSPLQEVANTFEIDFTDDELSIAVSTATEFEQLCNCSMILKGAASAVEHPIHVRFQDRRGQTFYPRQFG